MENEDSNVIKLNSKSKCGKGYSKAEQINVGKKIERLMKRLWRVILHTQYSLE